MVNKVYHEQQNELLDIPELNLAEHRPGDNGKWVIANTENIAWEAISFKKLADMINRKR